MINSSLTACHASSYRAEVQQIFKVYNVVKLAENLLKEKHYNNQSQASFNMQFSLKQARLSINLHAGKELNIELSSYLYIFYVFYIFVIFLHTIKRYLVLPCGSKEDTQIVASTSAVGNQKLGSVGQEFHIIICILLYT